MRYKYYTCKHSGMRDHEGSLTGFPVLKRFYFTLGLCCLECYRLSAPFEIKLTWPLS